jgi:ATP-dependent DNA helicase RecG
MPPGPPANTLDASPPPAGPGRRAATAAGATGPARALAQLGLARDIDRALHLPLRWEDETCRTAIADLRDGDTATVEALVERTETSGSRRTWVVTVREAPDPPAATGRRDGDGIRLQLRFLHVHPAHRKTLQPGVRVRVRGEARVGFFGREMVHPQVRAVDAGTPWPQTLTPVYPTTAGLPQAYLRRAVEGSLARADLSDLLPPALRETVNRAVADAASWPSLQNAVMLMHRPPRGTDPEALLEPDHPARRRLKFDELLAQQLAQAEARAVRARERAPAFAGDGPLVRQLRAALPFALTDAQQRVVAEIAADLARPVPMHRLLQGDVGAGKTVVAALAAAQVIDAGWQCALMAPTEILAAQHVAKLVGWLEPLGVRVAWLSGSRQGKARREARERVACGEAQLVVGTHAVIEDEVRFARLGLAVIDEQHRFGVEQRLALRRKLEAAAGPTADAASAPLQAHVLGMSATPIPRTLAMTLFADLDVSTIDTLPPGRTPIVTRVFAEDRRDQVIGRLRDELARGRQAYWVCPLVEAVEPEVAADPAAAPPDTAGRDLAQPPTARRAAARDRLAELANVIDTHRTLTEALPGVGVGLLHGRLPAKEKAAVMVAFAEGRLGVLAATTVIEVGVDVPNASVMVIEHAERFGLAQLHQLRGRVGRGAAASVCVLLYGQPLSPVARERLKVMAQTTDGFEIARRDLELRGPGEMLGARQSGAALLRFADIAADADLVAPAHEIALALWRDDAVAARRIIDRFRSGKSDYLNA